jgi:hypothetical protein
MRGMRDEVFRKPEKGREHEEGARDPKQGEDQPSQPALDT